MNYSDCSGIHPDDDTLKALHEGTLTRRQAEACMEHIGGCCVCADKYAALICEADTFCAPPSLAADIAVLIRERESRRQMVFYDIKVAAAAAAAVLMLFSPAMTAEAAAKRKAALDGAWYSLTDAVGGYKQSLDESFADYRMQEIIKK